MGSFDALPTEVWSNVFSCLRYKDVSTYVFLWWGWGRGEVCVCAYQMVV